MTRYTVGNDVVFIVVTYKFKDGTSPVFSSVFLPWRHVLDKIHLRKLKCIEHHKVPDYWDGSETPECPHDGFIFEGDGHKWYNQYPRASYGQLSDSGNWKIIIHPNSEEEEKVFMDDDTVLMTDVCYYLSNMLRGMFDLRKSGDTEQADMLQAHYNEVVELVAKTFNLQCVAEPLRFKHKDDPDKFREIAGSYRVDLKSL